MMATSVKAERRIGWTDFVAWLLQVPILYAGNFGWGAVDEFIVGRRFEPQIVHGQP